MSIAANAIERKAEKEKKKVEKKVKKTVHRIMRLIFWTVLVLCFGFFVGVHRRVIKAWLTGGEMPEVPEGHCHTFFKK